MFNKQFQNIIKAVIGDVLLFSAAGHKNRLRAWLLCCHSDKEGRLFVIRFFFLSWPVCMRVVMFGIDSGLFYAICMRKCVFIYALLFITFITSDRNCFILISSIDSVPMRGKIKQINFVGVLILFAFGNCVEHCIECVPCTNRSKYRLPRWNF